ncbi:MAG: STAS domain-containing protein [Planctomycetota bacterium]
MSELLFKTVKFPQDIMVVGLEGILDGYTQSDFDMNIKKFLDEGIYRFVFDLSKISAISSSGIGAFIKVASLCKENYGDVIIVQAQPNVIETLHLFGLPNYIQMLNNVNDAVKILSK